MSKPAGIRTQKPGGNGRNPLSPLPDVNDWVAVGIIAAVVIFFYRDILLQNAYLWEDFLAQYYPFRYFAAVSMANGELPLWNPYTFNGMPFQADIQSALFYLPNMLLSFFVSGGELHFFWLELQLILHVIIGGIGMYFLAKEFRLQSLPALFSGIVFALSGFMITHTIHQPIICQVAWFPLIFLLFRRAILRSSLRYTILGGLLLGMAVLAGFPQISLYFFFFLFLYFLFEFSSAARDSGAGSAFRLIPPAGGVIIIALAVAALQLLPTIELAPLSQRAEITYEKSLEGSLSWAQLIIGIVPKFFGVSSAVESTYWGPGVYWAYWETSFYIGIAGLIAALLAIPLIRKNRTVAFLFGLIVFTLLYIVGDSFILHKFFFTVVPGFSKFRSIGRLTILTTLAGALLAGYGVEEFLRAAANRPGAVKRVTLIIGGAGLLLWFAVNAGIFQPTDNPGLFQQVHPRAVSETTTALLFVIAVCGLLFLTVNRTLSATAFCILLPTIQCVDINIFGSTQNNGPTNPKEYYARTAQLVSFLQDEGKKEYFRVNSRGTGGMILDRNQGMVDRLFLMEGYTPLALQRMYPLGKDFEEMRNLSNVKYFVQIDEKQRSMSLGQATNYFPRAFMVYRIKVIKDEAEERSFLGGHSYDPARFAVLGNQPESVPADTAWTGDWSAAITSYRLNSINLDISTPKDGYCVLSEVYYPGWHATVDGKEVPLYRADWCLRTFPVPAGKHHVEVTYEPAPFRRGLWITFATLGISLVGLVFSLKRKKAPTNSAEV